MTLFMRSVLAAAGFAGFILAGCAAGTRDEDKEGTSRDYKPWTKDDGLEPAEEDLGRDGDLMVQDVDRILTGWPEKSREAARAMIDKYGRPDEIAPSHLHWYGKGPWKETTVSKEEVTHNWPKPHTDVLEQSIAYKVPADKFDELAAFDGSVIAERTKGTLSARCDKEEMNFLAINLAHDVITGKRSVEDARRFYEETAMAFMKGDKRPYTEKLQFEVERGKTGDPDQGLRP